MNKASKKQNCYNNLIIKQTNQVLFGLIFAFISLMIAFFLPNKTNHIYNHIILYLLITLFCIYFLFGITFIILGTKGFFDKNKSSNLRLYIEKGGITKEAGNPNRQQFGKNYYKVNSGLNFALLITFQTLTIVLFVLNGNYIVVIIPAISGIAITLYLALEGLTKYNLNLNLDQVPFYLKLV